MYLRWFAILTTLPLIAQVPAKIDIDLDGQPFTTFNSRADVNKPYLWPVRTADGKAITRRWPMEQNTGESHDHPHHRGLWFSYDDVNGIHFWGNDPSEAAKDPKTGKIVVQKAALKNGGKTKTLTTDFD